MRKTLLTLLLVGSLHCQASDEAITLGFSGGQVATEAAYGMAGKGWVEGAVRVPAAMLATYQGNAITSLRAALVARTSIDTLRLWVRHSLDGADLATATLTKMTQPSISKGWNEVSLSQPLAIDGDDDLYIGYSVYQKATAQALSTVPSVVRGTAFCRTGGGQWAAIESLQTMSIEALVTGESLPQRDLGVLSAQVFPQDGAYRVKAYVHNYGLQPVADYAMSCKADGTDIDCAPEQALEELPSGGTALVTLRATADGELPLTAQWTIATAADDDCPMNDGAEALLAYMKNVLVEEFTTERCVNCPTMAQRLHQALISNDEYERRVIPVCHHAGYYTDWLTQPCDQDMLWLYNARSTYAPAIMVNRQPQEAEGGTTPVYLPSTIGELTRAFDAEMEQTAQAQVSLDMQRTPGKLTITATARCTPLYDTSHPRMTIYLVEDSIKAQSQTGATGDFWHAHVVRAYNATWGTPVRWSDGSFTTSMTVAMDAAWQPERMQAVAVLSNYDSSSPARCAVDNCAAMPLPLEVEPVATGIESVDFIDHGTLTMEYSRNGVYDLTGRRVGCLGDSSFSRSGDSSFSRLGKVTSPNNQTTKQPNDQQPNHQTTKQLNHQILIVDGKCVVQSAGR